MPVDVCKASRKDLDPAAEALADAFTGDPVFTWILGGRPDPEQRLRRFFSTVLVEEFHGEEHAVYLAGDGAGAAIWKGIDGWKTPTWTMIRQAPNLARAFGVTNRRPLKVLAAMEKVHPDAPHYYLEAVGTRRDRQSKGVGTAVLQPMLERCDREGVPAYLESSNPRNIPFYARHGFEARDLVPLPSGAPPMTPMWREPRA